MLYTIHSLSGDHDPNFAFFSGLVIGRKLFKLKEYKNIFPSSEFSINSTAISFELGAH